MANLENHAWTKGVKFIIKNDFLYCITFDYIFPCPLQFTCLLSCWRHSRQQEVYLFLIDHPEHYKNIKRLLAKKREKKRRMEPLNDWEWTKIMREQKNVKLRGSILNNKYIWVSILRDGYLYFISKCPQRSINYHYSWPARSWANMVDYLPFQ